MIHSTHIFIVNFYRRGISISHFKIWSNFIFFKWSFSKKLNISKTRLLSNQKVTTNELSLSRFFLEFSRPRFFRSFLEGKGKCLERFGFNVERALIPLLYKIWWAKVVAKKHLVCGGALHLTGNPFLHFSPSTVKL